MLWIKGIKIIIHIILNHNSKRTEWLLHLFSFSVSKLIDWLIDWIGFYVVSAIFEPCKGGANWINMIITIVIIHVKTMVFVNACYSKKHEQHSLYHQIFSFQNSTFIILWPDQCFNFSTLTKILSSYLSLNKHDISLMNF